MIYIARRSGCQREYQHTMIQSRKMVNLNFIIPPFIHTYACILSSAEVHMYMKVHVYSTPEKEKGKNMYTVLPHVHVKGV